MKKIIIYFFIVLLLFSCQLNNENINEKDGNLENNISKNEYSPGIEPRNSRMPPDDPGIPISPPEPGEPIDPPAEYVELTLSDVVQYAKLGGFSNQVTDQVATGEIFNELQIAAAIGFSEPNPIYTVGGVRYTVDANSIRNNQYYGLWQIDRDLHRDKMTQYQYDNILNPLINAQIAYKIYQERIGDKWLPWHTYTETSADNYYKIVIPRTEQEVLKLYGLTVNGIYKITSRNSGLVIDVWMARLERGGELRQGYWHGGDNQKWIAGIHPDGSYSLYASHSLKAMDVQWGYVENGRPVWQWDVNSTSAQKWNISYVNEINNGHVKECFFRICSKLDENYCVDVSGVSKNDGALIHIWEYIGPNQENQLWKFEMVGKY